MRGRLTVGQLTVVISYLGAVYGPLSAIAHTTGQLQGAVAGAKRVRAMFALAPETVEAPDAIDATTLRGDVAFEGVGFTYPDGTAVLHDIAFEAKPGADDRARRPDRRGQDDAGEPDSAVLRCDRRARSRRRRGRAPISRPLAARLDRDRAAGTGAVPGNDRRQHALRPPRGDAEEVEDAARAAHAHEFISRLPKGYDTGDRRGRRRTVGRRASARSASPARS